MKKRLLIFKTGTYPQGEFSIQRVRNIFGNIKDSVKSIFVHSSKWNKEQKEPLDVGTWSDFEIIEKGNEAEVYATHEFNETGKALYPALKGASVEIPNDVLTKIAVLPIGTNPQIDGAEFDEKDQPLIIEMKEFEEGEKNLNLKEIKEFMKNENISNKLDLLSTVIDSFNDIESKNAVNVANEFAKKVGFNLIEKEPEKKQFTKEQWEAQYKTEFEAKEARKTAVNELIETNKKKIIPANKAEFEAFAKALIEADNTAEFEEGHTYVEFENKNNEKVQKSLTDSFKNLMNGMLEFQHGTIDWSEFSKKEENDESNNNFQTGIETGKNVFGL